MLAPPLQRTVTAGAWRRRASCPSGDRGQTGSDSGSGICKALRPREGFALPEDPRVTRRGWGPTAERPESQMPAAAQLHSGGPPPPPEPRSLRNLAVPISAPRNLLRLDHGRRLSLFGFMFPNVFRPTLALGIELVPPRLFAGPKTKRCEGDPGAQQAVSRPGASACAFSTCSAGPHAARDTSTANCSILEADPTSKVGFLDSVGSP